MPRVVHFCALLGTPRRWSLCLEGLYRKTAFSTSRQALLCSASRDRALVCSGSSCFRFGLRAAVPPKLCLRVRGTLVPAAVPAAYGCLPRGQWVPLDAEMFELIDRTSCLVEPVVVERVLFSSLSCSRKPAPGTSSAASSRCSRIYHRDALRKTSYVLSPSCSFPSCSCRS